MATVKNLRIGKSPNRLIQDLDVFDSPSAGWNDPWSPHSSRYHWQLHSNLGESAVFDENDFWCVCQKTRKHLHVKVRRDRGKPLIEEPEENHGIKDRIPVYYEEEELPEPHVTSPTKSEFATTSTCMKWSSKTTKSEIEVEWRDSYLDANCIKEIIDSRRPSFASLLTKKSSSHQGSSHSSQPSLFTTFTSLELFLRNVLVHNDQRAISAAPEGTFERHVGKGRQIQSLMKSLLFEYHHENVNYVPTIADAPLTDEQKLNLYLARNELIVLANHFRDTKEDPAIVANPFPVRLARPALINAFGVPNYDSVVPMYTTVFRDNSASLPDDPAFIALGITNDYPDSFVRYFYEEQKKNDEANVRVYADALAHIYNLRKSSFLRDLIAADRKNGIVSSDVIQAAYSSLGLEAEVGPDYRYSQEKIFEAFHSALLRKPEFARAIRNDLETIGYARKSSEILNYVLSTEQAFYTVNEAYQWLGIKSNTEDAMVASVALVKFEDDSDKAIEAVKWIAEERNSSILYDFLASQGRPSNKKPKEVPMDEDLAYNTLGVQDRALSDDVLINVYGFAVEDHPEQSDTLRAALKCIGEVRNSRLITHYLEHGNLDIPPEVSSLDTPIGLENTGNLCYLNSLIQYYFIIKPLRNAILDIDENKDLNMIENKEAVKKVGGRIVTRIEFLRALQFTYELRKLFIELITSKSSSVHPSSVLTYLALIPLTLDQVKSGTSSVMDLSSSRELSNLNERSITIDPKAEEQAQGLEQEQGQDEAKSPTEQSSSVNLIDFPMANTNGESQTQPHYFEVSEEEINSSMDLGRQQDVLECIDHVLFQLEASLGRISNSEDRLGSDNDLIRRLFSGKLKQTLNDASQGVRSNYEIFSHLIVDLFEEKQTLYDALDGVFETVNIDMGSETAQRSLCITELPIILQLQIQRVQFDRTTGQPFKSNAFVEFGKELSMDRYVEDTDGKMAPLLQRYWDLKREIINLQKRQQLLLTTNSNLMSSVDTLSILSKWAAQQQDSRLPINPKLPDILQEEINNVVAEVDMLKKQEASLKEERTHLFDNYISHSYDLLAVFVHRGQASFGHYWTYIHDFENNVYRKYNDEYVTVVDESEIFADTTGNNANPYMLTVSRYYFPFEGNNHFLKFFPVYI